MLESNREKASGVISYITSPQKNHTQPITSKNLLCHGLNIRFNLFDEDLEKIIEESFPRNFNFSLQGSEILSHVEVDWYSSRNLNIIWNDYGDHQCSFFQLHGKRLAIQRDFACFHQNERKILLFTDTLIDDGFFNFLRYFIPVTLLKYDRFIFHSSCVLNKEGEATLFLGHSGWGKSTITSMFPKNQALGDDMNLVRVKDGKVLVEPTHLGQLVTCWEKQGETYAVKNLFWLNKANTEKKVVIKNMSATEQRLKILGSLSGLFWDQIGESESQKVFSFLKNLLKNTSVKHFSFSLTSEVTKYV